MTQIILNVENPDIIPSLRKVLGQINGVTVSKMCTVSVDGKEKVLKSIVDGYNEVKRAELEGTEMPLLSDLISELRED